jgi:hypothetical protein
MIKNLLLQEVTAQSKLLVLMLLVVKFNQTE